MNVWVCDQSQRTVFTGEICGRTKQLAVCSVLFMCMYVCLCARVCVWSPLNDYYGLTPISRIESLYSRFFHSPGNGKENIFPSVAYETLSFALTLWDTKTHTRAHPPPNARPCAHWHQMTNQYLGLHGFYMENGCRVRTTNLNKDHRHIHKHTRPLWVTTETNHWSGPAVFRDNQSQWQAAPSTLWDICMGGVSEKYGGFPEGGGSITTYSWSLRPLTF